VVDPSQQMGELLVHELQAGLGRPASALTLAHVSREPALLAGALVLALPYYLEHNILEDDPFQVLDIGGVGKLIQMACELGRKTRQDLKLGICGEHGGEPRSVAFFDALGMNYVSCSPYRVPIARLAAAQSSLAERGTMDRTRATV